MCSPTPGHCCCDWQGREYVIPPTQRAHPILHSLSEFEHMISRRQGKQHYSEALNNIFFESHPFLVKKKVVLKIVLAKMLVHMWTTPLYTTFLYGLLLKGANISEALHLQQDLRHSLSHKHTHIPKHH